MSASGLLGVPLDSSTTTAKDTNDFGSGGIWEELRRPGILRIDEPSGPTTLTPTSIYEPRAIVHAVAGGTLSETSSTGFDLFPSCLNNCQNYDEKDYERSSTLASFTGNNQSLLDVILAIQIPLPIVLASNLALFALGILIGRRNVTFDVCFGIII